VSSPEILCILATHKYTRKVESTITKEINNAKQENIINKASIVKLQKIPSAIESPYIKYKTKIYISLIITIATTCVTIFFINKKSIK
jgi:hypothetical protein